MPVNVKALGTSADRTFYGGVYDNWDPARTGTCADSLCALHVPSTLFHLYARLEPGAGDLNQRAIIRAAGPVFCLCLSLLSWFGYKKTKPSRPALPLLYLAWFGVVTFFGNLMGTPFVGL